MLDKLDLQDAAVLKDITVRLGLLQKKLAIKERLIVQVTAGQEQEGPVVRTVADFIRSFEASGELLIPVRRDFGLSDLGARELFRVPATVSYTAVVTDSAPVGSPLQAAQQVLATMLTTNELWVRIRGNGGAYGVSTQLDLLEQLFLFSTYRDPRIAGSLADYDAALKETAATPPESSAVEDALIMIVGKEIRPLSPRQKAGVTFRRDLYRFTDDFRAYFRSLVCAVTPQDISRAAEDILERLGRHSRTVILGGKALLEKEGGSNMEIQVPIQKLPL